MLPAVVTRFAPSPTGALHLGHAYAALFAFDAAHAAGGRLLVRIEDIDAGRSRPDLEAAIFADLRWLGLVWEEPVRRQSEHLDDYAEALGRLAAAGLTYPCFCTRRQILEEISRAASAPQGPEGPVYPGSCRGLDAGEARERVAAGELHVLRLRMDEALRRVERPLTFVESGSGIAVPAGVIEVRPEVFGDVVLARKDAPTSYHLAVTVDDALQGVTLVTRGEDLFPSTHVHRLLQELLGLAVPEWRHHRLIRDEAGRRLAKRDAARALAALRAEGVTPAEVRGRIGL
jgi:glutamyl-Q tRNA(Asp) synthetase